MTVREQLRVAVPTGDDVAALRTTLGAFTPQAWLIAFAAGALMLLVVGGTTAIFDNDYFSRMTPVRVQDYVVWVVSSVLVGLLAGTFVLAQAGEQAGKTIAGGFLADVAVACPACNKVVVLLLGSSGALTFFGPLQLFLGVGAVALLVAALLLRARAIAGTCPLPAAAQ